MTKFLEELIKAMTKAVVHVEAKDIGCYCTIYSREVWNTKTLIQEMMPPDGDECFGLPQFVTKATEVVKELNDQLLEFFFPIKIYFKSCHYQKHSPSGTIDSTLHSLLS
ncbi:MAG: hypothetical protein OXC82_11115 [Rhodobacteraceae bacterium]|nr:hypothetical protein [Paracoccaceae bacterium]MCY4250965.1 hypothetical protein [Paracoccaceae bacterium]